MDRGKERRSNLQRIDTRGFSDRACTCTRARACAHTYTAKWVKSQHASREHVLVHKEVPS